MTRMVVGLMVVGSAGVAGATAPQARPRIVYPLVQTDATSETLLAIARTDDGTTGFSGDLPIHLNFFDKDCLVRDREDELTPLDVDVYVYSGFATGIAKGAAEIHWALPDGCGGPCAHGDGPFSLIGEAVILNFAADTMIGYSGVGTFRSFGISFCCPPLTFSDQVLALPHFLAEAAGVLTNEIALAAVPNTDELPDVDTYLPAPEFKVRWRMYDGNEEEASAQTTWKCVLHASLSSIFGDIVTLGFLPPDDQGPSPKILFYPYGWVRAAIQWPGNSEDETHGAAGIFRQQYVDGTFGWGEATNLWELNRDSYQEAVDGPCIEECID